MTPKREIKNVKIERGLVTEVVEHLQETMAVAGGIPKEFYSVLYSVDVILR